MFLLANLRYYFLERPSHSFLFWLLFATILYVHSMNFEVGKGNVASDLAAIESLVERHTFFINQSSFADTIDKFRRPDGRFFSQKSPIFHLVGAALYAPLFVSGFSLRHNLHPCILTLVLFLTILPMAVLL